MDPSQEEKKRLDLKKKVNHILEPLLVDILIAKPSNPTVFMREWL